MLPLFKKSHIHSRHVEKLLKTGHVEEYAAENNKRNALRQASFLYRIIDNELFRHGTDREYAKYGLRLVVHDDQPQKKAEIIAKCHLDNVGSHLGMNNTIKNVTDTYYWQGISAHVKMYLKQCEQCKARSKFNAEEWLELERKNIDKKKAQAQVMNEAQQEIRNLGRVKKPTPPETFFIVNAERKVDFNTTGQDESMTIDSNNIEYVVETLGQSDGFELEEVCHVLNVLDIVPIPERFRSREIETFLRDGTYPDGFTSNMRCGLRGPSNQYKLIEGELYHEGNKAGSKGMRLVIHDDLPALKVKVMVECHIDEDGSHHGLNKTLNKIGEKYHWVGMSVDVRKFMMHCKICSEQRGKRAMFDEKEYEEEAQQVKSRHLRKMNEAEAASSDTELTNPPVSYDSTDIEPTEGLEQEGHQVIRLIGPNKEVTEITVAVVNQETVTADDGEPNQMVQELEGGKGQSLVSKEMTDVVAQIEAAEAAMEMEGLKTEQTEKIREIKQEGEVENEDTNEEVLIMKAEVDEDDESETVVTSEHSLEAIETGTVECEGEVAQMETENGLINVVIMKEGDKTEDMAQDGTTIVGEVGADGMVVLASGEEQILEEVARQNETGVGLLAGVNSETFYRDVIYLPVYKKTRMIENFFKLGIKVEGLSHNSLLEMSENFEMVDNVLYRRPSRYKGRQVVIHDDTPELKYKIISEMHLKRNGQHCSELITFQNVSFKYFWEEMKWDIHRWYVSCKTCVNDKGVERKTNKKVLSLTERKQLSEDKKRDNKMISGTILKSRESKMRNRAGMQFDRYIMMGKNGGGTGVQIVPGTSGSNAGDESDVEIHIPESGNDKGIHVVKVRKMAPVTTYDLVVYATVEQERCIRDMYVRKHWSYSPTSFTKATIEEIDTDDDEDYYLLSLEVTAYQENAIKDLFKTMGLAVEASEEQRQESGHPVGLTAPRVNSNQAGEPASGKPEIIIVKPEPGNKTEEIVVKPPGGAIKMLEAASQTPVVSKRDNMQRGMKNQREIIEVSAKDLHKHNNFIMKDTYVVKQKVEHSPSKVTPQKEPVVSSPTVVKTTVTVPVVRSVTKQFVENTESPAPPVTPATPKRKINSVDETVETPATETRRSRREIKRPRRFSPDSSPQRTVAVKIEIASPKSDDENEIKEQKVVDKSKPMGKENLTKKMEGDSPKVGSFRNVRSAQGVPKTDAVRNLRSKGESGKKTDEVERKKTETSDNQKKAKVSVMSKGRIRVKKIVVENNKSQNQAKNSENTEQELEIMETDFEKLNDLNEGEDSDEEYEDEEDYFEDDDDDDCDEDDENDDDYDEDDDDVAEEADDLRVPLQIILDDSLEVGEANDEDGTYVCSLCDIKFRNKGLCVNHIQRKQCYKECESCGKMYKKKDQEQFKEHANLHTNGEKFPCTECRKVFYNDQQLQIHSRSHKNETIANCSRCQEEFHTWFQYASHMVHKHNDCNMFTCDVCSAKFANINFMKSEMRFDGNLSYFKCVMCS